MDTGDSWMLEMKIYEVGKGLVRMSEMEWRDVIYTRSN